MAWRGRCNRNKYWGLPTPALRINSIERYRKAWWVFQDLARTAWLPQWFFSWVFGDGEGYRWIDIYTWFSYRSSIFFKLKLQESINNYNSTGQMNTYWYHAILVKITKYKWLHAGNAGHFKIFTISSLVYHPLEMTFAFVSLLVRVLVLYWMNRSCKNRRWLDPEQQLRQGAGSWRCAGVCQGFDSWNGC